jgi:hypothetical protein
MRLHGKPYWLVVVNNAYQYLPFADAHYAGDLMWWREYSKDLAKRFHGEKWGSHQTIAQQYGTSYVKCVHRAGLGTGDVIHSNGNSGFQAINLAYLLGSRRILLVGFDMKLGPNGEKHVHPDHPKNMVQAQMFSEWIHKAATLAKDLKLSGCEVVNCSVETALTCWPRATLLSQLEINRETQSSADDPQGTVLPA